MAVTLTPGSLAAQEKPELPVTVQPADENLLERAIQNMRSVQRRISERDAGDQTRRLQSEISSDLEKLIELAKQQQRSPNPSSASGDPQQAEQTQSQQNQKEQRPQEQPAGSNDAGQRKSNDTDAETSENVQSKEGSVSVVELTRRRELLKEVWGHLPPVLRQEMMNVYSEKFLPKYDDLVRRYFEALAEEQQPRGR
jgi:hypothetical protein